MEAHLQWMSEGRWLVTIEGRPMGFIVPDWDFQFYANGAMTQEELKAVQKRMKQMVRTQR